MAKRKRLSQPEIKGNTSPGSLEVKSIPRYPLGLHPPVRSSTTPVTSRPPIAQVAAAASTQAALDEVASELEAARAEGRLVQNIPLDAVKSDHLVRDRLSLDEDDMDALKSSLIARGQQVPIEVVDLGDGTYGLISGWRRLKALKELLVETGEDQFAHVQGIVKAIDSVSDSYLAMVEENEMRSNLSYYERARLAAEAAELGVFPTPKRAVQKLFASASSSKRSKIISFLLVHKHFHAVLAFPAAIPERLGLEMANQIEKDRSFATRLYDILRKAKPENATDERAILDRALKRASQPMSAPQKASAPKRHEVAPGIELETRKGKVVLSGKGVTESLQKDLLAWLAGR